MSPLSQVLLSQQFNHFSFKPVVFLILFSRIRSLKYDLKSSIGGRQNIGHQTDDYRKISIIEFPLAKPKEELAFGREIKPPVCTTIKFLSFFGVLIY